MFGVIKVYLSGAGAGSSAGAKAIVADVNKVDSMVIRVVKINILLV
ncbi:hypothetical protein FACS1894176_03500 [Bacteroidia bacterium]|nr:hypothetical protein FACS1894176_03500 [Bacteroidia bacterium]